MSAPRIPGGFSPGRSSPNSGPKPGLHRGFEPYFAPSETLIWQGAPSARFSFMSCGGLPILLFSIVVATFALFWNAMVWLDDGPQVFRLMGAAFLAFGLYAVIGQYVLDMFRRRNTLYAVTNQRIYTLETLFRQKLTTYPLTSRTPVALEADMVLIGPNPPRGPVLKTRGDTIKPAIDGITLRMLDDAPTLSRQIHEAERPDLTEQAIRKSLKTLASTAAEPDRGWQHYLPPTEDLLWHGRPGVGFTLVANGGFGGLVFGIIWVAITLPMTLFMFIAATDPIAFIVLPLFLAAGLYFLIGMHLLDRYRRRKTFYAMTDKAVYALEGIFSERLSRYRLTPTTPIMRMKHTLLIGPNPPRGPVFRAGNSRRNRRPEPIDGIALRVLDQAPEIHELLRNIQFLAEDSHTPPQPG